MSQTTVPSVRLVVRALAWILPVALAAGLASACADERRALGEGCLKDQDCLSGICSQLKCAASPPLLQGAPTSTAGPDAAGVPEAGGPEAGPDATPDAAGDAPSDAGGG
jgi:hypothetical protein